MKKPLKKKEVRRLIGEIFGVQLAWEKAADPQWTWYGNITYKNPRTIGEADYILGLGDREKALKKELRQMIGWWNYTLFLLDGVRFYKSLLAPTRK